MEINVGCNKKFIYSFSNLMADSERADENIDFDKNEEVKIFTPKINNMPKRVSFVGPDDMNDEQSNQRLLANESKEPRQMS